MAADAQGHSRPGGVLRRWWRGEGVSRRRMLLRRLLVGVPLGLLIALVIVTNTPVAKLVLLPPLERAFNVDIQARWVSIGPLGGLRLRGVKVFAPAVAGPASNFFDVESLDADISWGPTLRGKPEVTKLRLVRPHLRISQSIDDRSVNIASLMQPLGVGGATAGRGPAPTPGAPARPAPARRPTLPTILAQDVYVELGEHTGKSYTTLKRLLLQGSLTPGVVEGGRWSYDIRLAGTPTPHEPGVATPPSDRGSMNVTGTFDERGLRLELSDVALEEWPAAAAPTPVRAIYRDLALQGSVRRTVFTYEPDRGIGAEIVLDGVALTLPIPPAEPTAAVDDRLRMSNVTGVVGFARDSFYAKVKGLIADLPYTVDLRYEGTDLSAAFRCELASENFVVEKNPGLLPWAPDVVRERLRDFSSPTAMVNTRLVLSRGAPVDGQPAAVRVSGRMELANGAASFRKFAYPFINLAGVVSFDNDSLTIERITGEGPTGARLVATGRIAPLDDTAEADIRVSAERVPVDDVLAEALGADRREILLELVDRARYRRLTELGLISTPDQERNAAVAIDAAAEALARATAAGEPAQRIAELERTLTALRDAPRPPVFELGGECRIDVHVKRARGMPPDWTYNVDVRFDTLGLLPEDFGLPITGSDVHLSIDDDIATLTQGEFRGLRGGNVRLSAAVNLERDRVTKRAFDPDVSITAESVPIDPLFIHAIPGPDPEPGKPWEESFKGMLTGLGLSGLVNAEAKIKRREGGGLGYDVRVRVPEAAALPVPTAGQSGAARAKLAVSAGEITLDESRASFSLVGRLRSDVPGSTLDLDACEVAIDGVAGFSRPEGPEQPGRGPSLSTLTATVRATDLDVRKSVEDLIRPFSAAAADAIVEQRSVWNPAGRVDIHAAITSPSRGDLRTDVQFQNARQIAIDIFGGRLSIPAPGGAARFITHVRSGEPRSIQSALIFTDVQGAATRDAESSTSGWLTLDGALALTPAGTSVLAEGGGEFTPLSVRLQGGRFESALVRAVVEQSASEAVASRLARAQLAGPFDATVTLSPLAPGMENQRRTRIALEPQSLSFIHRGTPITLPRVQGRLEFDADSGVFPDLSVEGSDWSATFDGAWIRRTGAGGPRTQIETRLDLTASRLGDELRALLAGAGEDPAQPGGLTGLLDLLSVQVDGPLSVRGGDLRITAAQDDRQSSTSFRGSIDAAGGNFQVGVPITEFDGRIDVVYEQLPADEASSGNQVPPPSYSADIAARSLRASGLLLTDARARIVSGSERGESIVPVIQADCHGGRFAAQAVVRPAPRSGGQEPASRYLATLRFSDVRFGDVLADLGRTINEPAALASPDVSPAGVIETAAPQQTGGPAAPARGLLDAELSIAGTVGSTTDRRGRGSARVSEGAVLSLPLVLPLIEVSNLALPFGERLDYARADFFLDRELVTFEDVSVFSRSIAIFGFGTLTWPGLELDMRFNSRASRPIPFLSEILQGIRDELVTTRVSGKLGAQRIVLEQFSGTRRLLNRAMGGEQSESQRRLEEIERRARRERLRQETVGRSDRRPAPIRRSTGSENTMPPGIDDDQ